MKVNKLAIKRRLHAAADRGVSAIKLSLNEVAALIDEEPAAQAPAPTVTPESLRDLDAETLSALKAELKNWNGSSKSWTE